MLTNTLITYAVEGLSEEQIQELVTDLKKRAFYEKQNKAVDNPDFTLMETEIVKDFKEVTGLDLFLFDLKDRKNISTIQESLQANNKKAFELQFDYVLTRVLPEVNIYEHQVCSHGQNTASMCASVLGYSGSLDNPNLAPLNTKIQPEVGTNGQTIDLLNRQNDDVWVIKPASSIEEDSLFSDLIAKHPEKDKIRAIIDAGCHFRGILNEAVARMICKYLIESGSPLQGVLFFDSKSGKLFFMNKNQLDHPIALSGTRPEIIKMETGFDPNELFTYYDQDRITGTDITQASDAIAVITWSEHTKIHESLQGSRRLRELAKEQRLISATEQGALTKIGFRLNKREIEKIPIGKVENKELFRVQDLILFAHLNEVEAQREENLLFCIQKMENTLQQYILDKAYRATPEQERLLFSHSTHLFKKSISLDLYQEYAFKRKNVKIKDYLEALKNSYLKPLYPIIEEEDQKKLINILDEIIAESLKGLIPKIKISTNNKESNVSAIQNSESTMVQFRQQKNKQTTQAVNQQENEALQKRFSQEELNILKNKNLSKELDFKEIPFSEPLFELKRDEYTGSNAPITHKRTYKKKEVVAGLEIWGLRQVLSTALGENYQDFFDNRISMTSNFAIAFMDQIDIFGNFRKIPAQWLLICDEQEGKKEWNLLFVSVKDAIDLKKQIEAGKLPKGRKMALLRAYGEFKSIAISEDLMISDIEADEEVRALITQALLFGGKLDQLNKKKWLEVVDKTIPPGPIRKAYSKFLEEKIFFDRSLLYLESPLFKLLNE